MDGHYLHHSPVGQMVCQFPFGRLIRLVSRFCRKSCLGIFFTKKPARMFMNYVSKHDWPKGPKRKFNFIQNMEKHQFERN